MALVNAILIHWSGGYRTAQNAPSIAAYGRHEAFLELGSANSEEEVDRIAGDLLGVRGEPEVATTVAMEPAGGDRPYEDFGVGDWLTCPDEAGTPTSFRVNGLAVSEDPEGQPVFVPELRTKQQSVDTHQQRWLKRMANGALGGSTNVARPVTTPLLAHRPVLGGFLGFPPWSWDGLLEAGAVSGRFYPPRSGRLLEIDGSLRVAGTTPTVVDVLKNGVSLGSVTFEAGSNTATPLEVFSTFTGDLNDYFQMQIATAGSGAEDLVVVPKVVG